MNKHRIALTMVENAKVYIEKAWPEDKELINRVRDILLRVCVKVHNIETKGRHVNESC